MLKLKNQQKNEEIKSPKEDKNTADNCLNWFDKNKLKNFLAIMNSSKSKDEKEKENENDKNINFIR